jgi:DNA polymerase
VSPKNEKFHVKCNRVTTLIERFIITSKYFSITNMKENLSMADVLRWYLDSGVEETICDVPQNRLNEPALKEETLDQNSIANTVSDATQQFSAEAEILLHNACEIAAGASSVEELKNALLNYGGCPLKKTATNLVFGDGSPKAKIVLIGEGPGAEEDRSGLPFVGPSGQLLDKMLASIGLDREKVFLSNIVFWRPPGNRTPTSQETNLCMPFVERLMELIDPEILVILGGSAAKSMLAETAGVSRLRGKWYNYSTPNLSRPVQATVMFSPGYLLNSPVHKREAWQDLLMIRNKFESLGLN